MLFQKITRPLSIAVSCAAAITQLNAAQSETLPTLSQASGEWPQRTIVRKNEWAHLSATRETDAAFNRALNEVKASYAALPTLLKRDSYSPERFRTSLQLLTISFAKPMSNDEIPHSTNVRLDNSVIARLDTMAQDLRLLGKIYDAMPAEEQSVEEMIVLDKRSLRAAFSNLKSAIDHGDPQEILPRCGAYLIKKDSSEMTFQGSVVCGLAAVGAALLGTFFMRRSDIKLQVERTLLQTHGITFEQRVFLEQKISPASTYIGTMWRAFEVLGFLWKETGSNAVLERFKDYRTIVLSQTVVCSLSFFGLGLLSTSPQLAQIGGALGIALTFVSSMLLYCGDTLGDRGETVQEQFTKSARQHLRTEN